MKLQALRLVVATLATGVAAFRTGPAPQRRVEPTLTENFPWRDLFSSKDMAAFTSTCEATKTFQAREYTLHELYDRPPMGLWPWGNGLKKVFMKREYPGGWGGMDRHQYNRNLLLLEYADVPVKVKEWIEEEERTDGPGQGLFAVFIKPPTEGDKIERTASVPETKASKRDASEDKSKVVIFAPGAMYSILPLWVAEGSECEVSLSDLSKYSAELADGAVVAWPRHTKPQEDGTDRKMEFTIKAQLLRKNPEAERKDDSDSEKDEL